MIEARDTYINPNPKYRYSSIRLELHVNSTKSSFYRFSSNSVSRICMRRQGGREEVGGGKFNGEQNDVTPRRKLHCSDGQEGNLIVADTPKHWQGSNSISYSIQNTLCIQTAMKRTNRSTSAILLPIIGLYIYSSYRT